MLAHFYNFIIYRFNYLHEKILVIAFPFISLRRNVILLSPQYL